MHKTFSQPASRIFLLLIVLVISSRVHPVFSQTIQFSGTITEHEDNDPIPGATLHILGTSRGARTNADGRFHLLLDSGMKYSVRITALGYRPDTLHIQLFKDRKHQKPEQKLVVKISIVQRSYRHMFRSLHRLESHEWNLH